MNKLWGCVLLLAACGGAAEQLRPVEHPIPQRPVPRREAEALHESLTLKGIGLKTPESVLYDARSDVYLVSNIDGSPLDEDDQAFISRIRPDGRVEALKWIDAARPDVTLHAPKGMALAGDVLYVADISVVRKFDRQTGAALGAIALPWATFVNDLSADGAGNIYASDSGISHGFRLSGTDAVYKIDARDQVAVVADSETLGRPNGLSVTAKGLWVATFGSGELYALSPDGQRSGAQKLPKGSLDGIALLGERLFVSSWEASAIYERKQSAFVEIVSNVAAPSDIGVDERRRRLLIPLFYDDALVIHQL